MSDRLKIITVRAKGGKLMAIAERGVGIPIVWRSLRLELRAQSRGGKQGGIGEKIGVGSAAFIGSSCPKMAGFGDRVVVSLPA